jgi:ABC-type polysaccharide/polyol phosphate transport system ATPase subunit
VRDLHTRCGRIRVETGITPILELGVGWNPELDAVDNIFLIGSIMGLSLRAINASIDGILAFAEVERFARLKLKHYSSGMASRLAYAIAFEAVREVLVLDEIFAVGDAGFKAKCGPVPRLARGGTRRAARESRTESDLNLLRSRHPDRPRPHRLRREGA